MKNFAFGFVLALAALAAPSLVRADMLHWGIYGDPDVVVWGDGSTKPLSEFEDAWGARVIAFDADDTTELGERTVKGYLDLYVYDSSAKTYVSTDGDTAGFPNKNPLIGNWSDLGDYASADYAFAIAIFDEYDRLIALSDAVEYGSLLKNISDNPLFAELPRPWTQEGFVVPEPSGGMLTMLGLMLLGLKRKQEVA